MVIIWITGYIIPKEYIITQRGIIPKIKDGYYYPFSNQATTIKNALVDEVINSGVIIKNNFLVTEISKEDKRYFYDLCVTDYFPNLVN